MRVLFTVPGKPRGKARPRFNPNGGPPITPKATRQAEKEIAWEFTLARRNRSIAIGEEIPIMTGTIRLTIEAVFRVPTSWPKKMREAALAGEVEYTGKPDRDNIDKLVMDALNGVAWLDDAQVNKGPTVRRYGEPERVEVMVEELQAAPGLKSPAERRREKKLAAGPVIRAKRKKRPASDPRACELHAIGRRLK